MLMVKKSKILFALYYEMPSRDQVPDLVSSSEQIVRAEQKKYQEMTGNLAWVKVGSMDETTGKFRSL